MSSRDLTQLTGVYETVSTLSTNCAPIVSVSDLGDNVKSVNNKTLNSTWPAIPCGLVAKSFFNDNYTIFFGNATIPIAQTGIAWAADISLFKNT